MFLNLGLHMCKLSRLVTSSCRLMKPKRHVTSPSTICINKRDLQTHLALHSLTQSSLSFFDWFVQRISFPQTCGSRRTNCKTNYKAKISKIVASLISVDHHFDRSFCARISFLVGRIYWHRNRGILFSLTTYQLQG